MQIHTAKSKDDLLHADTHSCSCTCFWQDNNQNLMSESLLKIKESLETYFLLLRYMKNMEIIQKIKSKA